MWEGKDVKWSIRKGTVRKDWSNRIGEIRERVVWGYDCMD